MVVAKRCGPEMDIVGSLSGLGQLGQAVLCNDSYEPDISHRRGGRRARPFFELRGVGCNKKQSCDSTLSCN